MSGRFANNPDNPYCYDVIYILFHTGIRISEFCGLTVRDVDLKNKILNIDHQLQRTSDMKYVIEKTKTNAGSRKLPMNDDVTECFRRILKAREAPEVEKIIDGHCGFLFLDDNGMPEVVMHWEHRFNHMVHRYNEIFREQIDDYDELFKLWNSTEQSRRALNPVDDSREGIE